MPIKYTRDAPRCQDWALASKTRGNSVKCHYKNTYETAMALRGMNIPRAKKFLKNVIRRREIVPFRRFTGGVGRQSQCKGTGVSHGRWPRKSALVMLDLVRNLEVNAKQKNLNDSKQLIITHVAVNRARQGRRRTYRAHGRINPFNSHPAHIEMFCEKKQRKVPKSKTKAAGQKSKLSYREMLDKKQRRNVKVIHNVLKVKDQF